MIVGWMVSDIFIYKIVEDMFYAKLNGGKEDEPASAATKTAGQPEQEKNVEKQAVKTFQRKLTQHIDNDQQHKFTAEQIQLQHKLKPDVLMD